MKQIDFNNYIVYCWGTLILLLVFLHEFQYDEETKNLLIYTCSGLGFLPFEIVCSKIVWFVVSKTNFEIKFLLSNRIVRVT
jgi:hypothetical protein